MPTNKDLTLKGKFTLLLTTGHGSWLDKNTQMDIVSQPLSEMNMNIVDEWTDSLVADCVTTGRAN